MRGKHRIAERGYNKLGITPADAGKTVVLVNGSGRKKDHPRGCGENCTNCVMLVL